MDPLFAAAPASGENEASLGPITDFMCGHETKVLLPTCPNKKSEMNPKSVGRQGVV